MPEGTQELALVVEDPDDRPSLEPGADYQRFHEAVQGSERARGELTGRYAR